MAGKKFAAEFALRRNVSAQDKILIQDSDDDVVKYAYPPQIASLSGYAYAQSVADLPLLPTNKSIGYIVGQMLYIYVGMGGDTKDGLYQSVGFFVGPQGVQGEKGEKGERGEQGVQGPKGDNGGLSLQELDEYLATKQYVTGDTLADMLAGYVSNTSLMRDYVTIAKTQDVTGVKNFTAGVQFGGLPMYKSKDDTVYLDGNLVVRGAVTMYGMNTTTSPSIFSALPIDGTTIGRNERGELYVIGGTSGGGSGTGGGISIADVENYLTTNGYATQSWVTGKGYITSSALEPYALKTAIPTSLKNPTVLSWSGYSSGSYDGSTAQSITIPNNTNQLTNGAGFITSITSSMVTNALGYTPLSTGGGTITGAGANPLTINRTTLDAVGLLLRSNSIIKGEFGWAPASGTYIYNAPSGGLLGIKDDGTPHFKGNTLLHSGNYSDYVLPKDGTAVAATTLKTSTGFLYTRTYDSSRIVNIGADATAEGYSTYIDGMFIRFRYGSAYTTAMQIGTDGNVAIGGTTATEKLHVYGNLGLEGCLKVVKSTYPDIRGNGSYLTLSPDDVAGSKGSVGLYKTGDSSYEFRRVWDHYSYGPMNLGSSSNRWTTVYGVAADFSGDIVGNNILAKGAITMYYSSDEQLKKNIRKVNASEVLMSLGGIWQYEYIDSEVRKNSVYDGTHFGLIYQNVKGKSLDKMCHKREDGMGALNYVDADFISIIAGATMENISEVEKLKRKIRTLENKVKQLERVA